MPIFIVLFLYTFLAYLFSAVCYILYFVLKKERLFILGFASAATGFVLGSAALMLRTLLGGFLPIANLFESLCFFAWCMVLIHLFLEKTYRLKFIGSLVMTLAVMIMGLAAVQDKSIAPLMPALKSYWLGIHVPLCFISYACFAAGFACGVMRLLPQNKLKPEVIDKIEYQMIAAGVPFLSLGIITGSVWAKTAWGSWWSWDPKETWALVTWIIYGFYLIGRIYWGLRGKKAAYVAIIGFLAVLFTYLGVSCFLPGRHSYAASPTVEREVGILEMGVRTSEFGVKTPSS